MSPPGAKPSPHPTSSILSSAAPAPHFHREKPGGRGRQRWENLHREETNSFPVFFFSLLWQNETMWPEGRTGRQTYGPLCPAELPAEVPVPVLSHAVAHRCSSALKGFVVGAHCFHSRTKRIILELNPQEQLKMKKKTKKKTTNTTQSPNPKFKGTLQSQQLPAQPRSDVGFGTNLGPVAHPHGRTALHLAGPRVATGFARGFATGAPWCSGFRHCSHGCGMQEEGLRPVGLRALPACLHVPLRFVYSKDKLFPY